MQVIHPVTVDGWPGPHSWELFSIPGLPTPSFQTNSHVKRTVARHDDTHLEHQHPTDWKSKPKKLKI